MTDKPQVPAQASPSDSLEAAAVAAYLEANPDFFVEHEELLPALRIPHQRGDTVSLVERQMKILRERNIEMRHKLSHLMDVARDNDRVGATHGRGGEFNQANIVRASKRFGERNSFGR